MKKSELLTRCEAMKASLLAFIKSDESPLTSAYTIFQEDKGISRVGWLTKCFAAGHVVKNYDDNLRVFWESKGIEYKDYYKMYKYINEQLEYDVFPTESPSLTRSLALSQNETMLQAINKNIEYLSQWKFQHKNFFPILDLTSVTDNTPKGSSATLALIISLDTKPKLTVITIGSA